MISISTIVADLTGSLVVMNTSNCNFSNRPARVSRSATLDGGAVIIHSGVIEGDRTFYLDCKISEDQETLINYIYGNSTLILVSCSEGLFLAAMSELDIRYGKLKATILIKSKENS